MDIFCLPTERPAANEIVEICSGWIPLQPRDYKLQRTSYDRSVRRSLTGFLDLPVYFLDTANGPPGYIVHVTNTEESSFCVLVRRNATTVAHAEVTLPYRLDALIDHPANLYLYFATVAGHPLLRDTKHWGSCFVVQKWQKNKLVLKYLCNLTFKQCWRQHLENELRHPFFMAQQVGTGIEVEMDPGK